MCRVVFVVLGFVVSLSLGAQELVRPSTCQAETDDELKLYSNDFSWGMELQEIKDKYREIYNSSKRLPGRAFIKDGAVVLPKNIYGGEVKYTRLPSRFLKSVRKHVEEAMKLKYVDALIFPDMGHSHLFIPIKDYEVLRHIPVKDVHLFYEKVFDLEGLKILYHTAEQLKMVDENRKLLKGRLLQWRFYTRNLVGSNQARGKLELLHEESSSHNTARSYRENYRYYGAGFNISASKGGCFPFKVGPQTYYFDLSFEDLAPRGGTLSGSGNGGWY